MVGLAGAALGPLVFEHAATRVDLLLAPAEASPTLWYVTRASAMAAYLTLSLSVMLGMLRTVARQSHERLSWVVDELHQVIATLAMLLVGVHLITLVLDPFLPFSVANLLVPLSEPYRPLAVQIGVGAFYTMALVAASSWIRRRIRYQLWRGIHYLSLVAFALATAHGLLAGSDTGEPWMRAVYAGAAAAVAFLTLVRVFAGAPSTSQQKA
jgi:methionine sulfoxide reductase heme-binding subunit